MKRILFALGMVLAGTFAASQAQAQVTLGLPGYGGNGCPQGTVSASLSPDGSTLAIIFDQYMVEVGAAPLTAVSRKSCNVSIPINVPQGISISLVSVDYRGFNALTAGARSTFNVEYFFAGGRGPVFNQPFTGPLTSDYTIHNELLAGAVVWSPCGASPLLRTNANLTVQANPAREYSFATVDSEDVAVALLFHLQWMPCT